MPPQAGEREDSSLGSDMPGTETEDEAFGLDRRRRTSPPSWTRLVGMTPSQAAPHITASLEADIRALGGPTQESAAASTHETGGHATNSLPPTLPWAEQWHTLDGGDSADAATYYQNEPLHAAGLD